MLGSERIRELALKGMIEPFSEDQLQPAGYDLRLSRECMMFQPRSDCIYNYLDRDQLSKFFVPQRAEWISVRIGGRDARLLCFQLPPFGFLNARSVERISLPEWLCAEIKARSSFGRLGFTVVKDAGYLDPGYSGCPTVEIHNLLPIPVFIPAMVRFAQIRFQEVSGSRRYSGKYGGDEIQLARLWDELGELESQGVLVWE